MFLGYQNNKVAFIGNTREELENLPCVVLDRIEETDQEYFLYEGEYVTEVPAKSYEEVKETRATEYANRVDPLMAEYNRKKTFNLFEDGEEEALLKEIERLVAEIKEANPYPAEESN